MAFLVEFTNSSIVLNRILLYCCCKCICSITGYFSTSLKKKSFYNLCFIIIFYGVIRLISQLFLGKFHITSLLFFTNQNWFILCYLGLVLMTPILNAYVQNVEKNVFKIQLLLLFSLSIVSDFIPGIGGVFNRGCSVLSFSIIYLLGRYIRIYGLPSWVKRRCVYLYALASFVIFIGICTILYFKLPQVALFHWLYYSNPVIIFSAVCFLEIFLQREPYSNKVINHVAKSCLAVLLLHVPYEAPFWNHMQVYFKELMTIDNFLVIPMWLIGVMGIYVLCTGIDQIRLFLWNLFDKYWIRS